MRLNRLCPSLLGFGDQSIALFGHPYALARTALRWAFQQLCPSESVGQVLDVGCGSMPYRHLFPAATIYHGLEIDKRCNRQNTNVTHWYKGDVFPMQSSSYQLVICSQVLEHSFEPDQLLAEMFRVLQPGGLLLLSIPFCWPEHEQPYDSQRFTSFGLRHRLELAGFLWLDYRKTNPGLAALVQLTIAWLEGLCSDRLQKVRSKTIRNKLTLIWRLVMVLPYSILNLIGVLYRFLTPVHRNSVNADLFLDLVVIARKP